MKQTKKHILDVTTRLFNERGFVNIRLQHIADEANLSIGNLAYHFPTKKDLLSNVYDRLVQAQIDLLNELCIVPLFEHIDRRWDNVYSTQNTYAFFYQDTLEILRYDQSIAEKYRKHIEWEKEQYQQILEFNCSRGAMVGLHDKEEVKQKAELIWLMENSWLQLAIISDKQDSDVKAFKQFMWQSLTPYFSPIGQQEYRQLMTQKIITYEK